MEEPHFEMVQPSGTISKCELLLIFGKVLMVTMHQAKHDQLRGRSAHRKANRNNSAILAEMPTWPVSVEKL